MAQSAPTRRPPSTAWKPGQSGNPMGRHKTRPITSIFLKALNEPVSRTDKRTLREAIRQRLTNIILRSDDKRSLDALKLLWSYMEGQPQSTVELQFQRALEDIAAKTGAPKLWLVQKSKEIEARYAGDGLDVPDGDGEPPDDRIKSVRRHVG